MDDLKHAVTFINMLADWYEEYEHKDSENAKTVRDERLKGAFKVSASAWNAAAYKARELAKILDADQPIAELMSRVELWGQK